MESKKRARSKFFEHLGKEMKENPVVEHLEDTPIPGITKEEHILGLQKALSRAAIDYVKENGLTDVFAVHFNLDDIQSSVEEGDKSTFSDSHIRVDGVRCMRDRLKNGEIREVPYWYIIGERRC